MSSYIFIESETLNKSSILSVFAGLYGSIYILMDGVKGCYFKTSILEDSNMTDEIREEFLNTPHLRFNEDKIEDLQMYKACHQDVDGNMTIRYTCDRDEFLNFTSTDPTILRITTDIYNIFKQVAKSPLTPMIIGVGAAIYFVSYLLNKGV